MDQALDSSTLQGLSVREMKDPSSLVTVAPPVGVLTVKMLPSSVKETVSSQILWICIHLC